MGSSSLNTRIAERVATDLRERILGGRLADNLLPKQEELIAEFGVSAPSIREALRILEAEGLVTIRRGRFGGAEVTQPNATSAAYALGLAMQGQRVTLDDLAESLRALEPMSAASCALRKDRMKVLVPLLEANLSDSEDALGGPGFTWCARRFHHLVVDSTLNEATRLIVRSLVAVWSTQEENWAQIAAREGDYPDVDEQKAVLRAHRRIASEIVAGSASKAEELARRHLEATQNRILLAMYGNRTVDMTSPAAVGFFRRVTSQTRAHHPEH